MTAPIAFFRVSFHTLAAIGLFYPDRTIPWTADDLHQFGLLGSLLLAGGPAGNEATDLSRDVMARVNYFDCDDVKSRATLNWPGLWPIVIFARGADRRHYEERFDLTLPILWAAEFLLDQMARLSTPWRKQDDGLNGDLHFLANNCRLRLKQLRHAFVERLPGDNAQDLTSSIEAVNRSIRSCAPLMVITFPRMLATLPTAHAHLRLVDDA